MVGVVSVLPTLALGQAVSQNGIVGAWRSLNVAGVDWDSATGNISVRLVERRMTLRSDGSYASASRVMDSGVTRDGDWMLKGKAGPWSLAGDTLLARYNAADSAAMVDTVTAEFDRLRKQQGGKAVPPSEVKEALDRANAPVRWILARNGDTLTTRWADVADILPLEWVRVDTTKPLPALDPPPATLQWSDLVGTWVAKASMKAAGLNETVADTVVLRADSTWAANAKFDKTSVLSGCGLGMAGKSKESSDGTWYIGPANTIVLIDSFHRKVCGAVGHWRGGGAVKLQGQQLIPQNDVFPAFPVYTRTSSTTP